MGPDLDTDQRDGNLESPFPPFRHRPTLALCTTLELQNTPRGYNTADAQLLSTTRTSGSGSTGRSDRDIYIPYYEVYVVYIRFVVFIKTRNDAC